MNKFAYPSLLKINFLISLEARIQLLIDDYEQKSYKNFIYLQLKLHCSKVVNNCLSKLTFSNAKTNKPVQIKKTLVAKSLIMKRNAIKNANEKYLKYSNLNTTEYRNSSDLF